MLHTLCSNTVVHAMTQEHGTQEHEPQTPKKYELGLI